RLRPLCCPLFPYTTLFRSLAWTLGKIVFPITIAVTILQYTPILPWFIDVVAPLMGLIGLPGEAAMPLVLGNALNLYAAIGAIVSDRKSTRLNSSHVSISYA